MEHRWGERIATNVTARVGATAGSFHIARLTDLSVSGAFLRLSLPVDELHPIFVEPALNGQKLAGEPLEAYVVRSTPEGVGIEWADFGSQTVLQLIAAHKPWPHLAPETLSLPQMQQSG